jgi:hypothetical protein
MKCVRYGISSGTRTTAHTSTDSQRRHSPLIDQISRYLQFYKEESQQKEQIVHQQPCGRFGMAYLPSASILKVKN